MTPLLVLAVASAAGAAALGWPWSTSGRHPVPDPPVDMTDGAADPWLRRGRPVWSLLAGLGPVTLLPGILGVSLAVVVGAAAGVACWRWAGRDPSEERRAAEVRRDLPGLALLLGCALETGCSLADALAVAAQAHSGAASEEIRPAIRRLRLGIDPVAVWTDVPAESGWAPLARALGRSARTGAEVADSVVRLADELAERRRAEATDRARRVGVAAAVPLGVCLLPSFLLLGIVPMAAGLAASLVR